MPINIDYNGQFAKGALEQMNKTREMSQTDRNLDISQGGLDLQGKQFDANKIEKEKERFQTQFTSALQQTTALLNSTQDPARREALLRMMGQMKELFTGPVAQQYGVADYNAKMIDFAMQSPTVQEQASVARTMAEAENVPRISQTTTSGEQGLPPGHIEGKSKEVASYNLLIDQGVPPTIAYGMAFQKGQTTFDPETKMATPIISTKAVDTLQSGIQNINALLQNPGLPAITGVRNPLKGALAIPFVEGELAVRGSPAASAKARLDQLRGFAFLDAYESLKGAGQITVIEGEKAEAAKARLKSAVSDDDFVAALVEWRDAMADIYNRLQTQRGPGQLQPITEQQLNAPMPAMENIPPPITPSQAATRLRFNPATGDFE